MTLFLFLLGLILITLIARYNESNKLFWALLTCYVLGFTSVKLAYDCFGKEGSKDDTSVQVQPTQGLIATSGSLMYLLADDSLAATVKETSKPVSKAIAPATNDVTLTSSNVSGVTQGQTVHILPNPPNRVDIIDDS